MTQQSNFDLSTDKKTGPVECLGQTFDSDETRRAHYTELLREKLKDPEFRKIEGFPIGEDEDILNLSDPPYYTACPNPWIGDFIAQYGKPYDPKEKYHREPFAADVSEGKNHPIYNAHSYHTKVPHRAIMRYILHYTEPGDVVFDGFCGTGMTGVAAQFCGDEKEVRALGYRVDVDGTVIGSSGNGFSRLGQRKSLINDLSPLATFIAHNLNNPINSRRFDAAYQKLIKELGDIEKELYRVKPTTGFSGGILNYAIWSDVYICKNCSSEYTYWNAGIDFKGGKTKKTFDCPFCGAEQSTRALQRAFVADLDPMTKTVTRLFKQNPVRLNYITESNKRINRDWSSLEKEMLDKIAIDESILLNFPLIDMPKGDRWNRDAFESKGVSMFHQFYTKRSIVALAKILGCIRSGGFDYKQMSTLLFLFTSFADRNATRRNRFIINKHNPNGRINGPMANCLYLPNLFCEMNIFRLMDSKKKDMTAWLKSAGDRRSRSTMINTGSLLSLTNIPTSSVDYIFTDPPFGHNIQYSELNFGLESFIGVKSMGRSDAVVNEAVGKALPDYSEMMMKAFSEYHRILKPKRWMTVEFHNSRASVWNAIQSAIAKSGFIIAHVATLDKLQKTVHQDTHINGTVNQDLIISAYKPDSKLREQILKTDKGFEGVWGFLSTHLKHLPILSQKAGTLEYIVGRDPRNIYDRMVAFYVANNTYVPLSFGEFQVKVIESFPQRDGMVFLPEQVSEYDKKAAQIEHVGQLAIFVEDEKSAINWLRQFLKDKPFTYQGIYPEFVQQLSASWKKFETRPELNVLLDQNFIKYSGEGEVPSQIHSYLSSNFPDLRKKEKSDPALKAKAKDRWYVPDPKKAVDVEAVRNKRLFAEFWDYAAQAGISKRKPGDPNQGSLGIQEPAKKKTKLKKLKEVRTEAIRYGFLECHRNKDAATILAIAEILPNNVVEEDEQLQMIVDMAEMRAE